LTERNQNGKIDDVPQGRQGPWKLNSWEAKREQTLYNSSVSSKDDKKQSNKVK
jgi:hypothetical protein